MFGARNFAEKSRFQRNISYRLPQQIRTGLRFHKPNFVPFNFGHIFGNSYFIRFRVRLIFGNSICELFLVGTDISISNRRGANMSLQEQSKRFSHCKSSERWLRYPHLDWGQHLCIVYVFSTSIAIWWRHVFTDNSLKRNPRISYSFAVVGFKFGNCYFVPYRLGG